MDKCRTLRNNYCKRFRALIVILYALLFTSCGSLNTHYDNSISFWNFWGDHLKVEIDDKVIFNNRLYNGSGVSDIDVDFYIYNQSNSMNLKVVRIWGPLKKTFWVKKRDAHTLKITINHFNQFVFTVNFSNGRYCSFQLLRGIIKFKQSDEPNYVI